MMSTNAIFPAAPGHRTNEGGIQASLFRATTIVADLDLRRHGLKQLVADPYHVQLDPDGASIAIWADPRKTADEIRHFSPKDAEAWLKLARTLDAAIDIAIPVMLTHPTRPASATARTRRDSRAAGTHPTGGISGIPGQLAARTVIRSLRRKHASCGFKSTRR
jgi:phytoene dehydrogenase-like protein